MTLVGRTEPNKTSWMEAASEAAGFVALPAAIAHQTVTSLRRWGLIKPTAFLTVSRFLPWVGMAGLITTGWQAVSTAKRMQRSKSLQKEEILFLGGALLTFGALATALGGFRRLHAVATLLGSALDIGQIGLLLSQSQKEDAHWGQIAFQLGMLLLFTSYQNPAKTFREYAGPAFEEAVQAEQRGRGITTGAEIEFRVQKGSTTAIGVEEEIFMPHRDTVYHALRDAIPGAELIPSKQTPFYDFQGRQAKILYGQQRVFAQPDGELILSDVLTGTDSGLMRYRIGSEVARPPYDTRVRCNTRAEVMAESERQLHELLAKKIGVDVATLLKMEEPSRRRTYWMLKTADGGDIVDFTFEEGRLFCTMGEMVGPGVIKGRVPCEGIEEAEQYLADQILGGKVSVRKDTDYEGILIPAPGHPEKARFGLVRDAYGTFEINPSQEGGVPVSQFGAYEVLLSAMEKLQFRGGNQAVPIALQEHISIPYRDVEGKISILPLLAVLRRWIEMDDLVSRVIPMEPGRANFCPPLSPEIRRLVWFGRLERKEPAEAFERLLVAFVKEHGAKYADCNFSPVAAVALRELIRQRSDLAARFDVVHPLLGGRTIKMALGGLKEIPTAEFRRADLIVHDLGEDQRIIATRDNVNILRFYVGLVHRALVGC